MKHRKFTTESWISLAKDIHDNKYDYSETIFTKQIDKVKINCLEHGEFFQRATDHLLGRGCPNCGKSKKKSKEDILNEARIIHKNKYKYLINNFKNIHSKIKIICPIHGEFEQRIYSHLQGYGCSKCSKNDSKYEIILKEFFIKNNFDVKHKYKPYWLKFDKNGRKELDIYIPDLNLAIEYNGKDFHHSTKGISKFLDLTYKEFDYHLNKFLICEKNNIKLLHIFDFEDFDNWINELQNYIDNRNMYNITFINNKRKINNLDIYGQSFISKRFLGLESEQADKGVVDIEEEQSEEVI